MADFNINLLNYQSNKNINNFLNLMYSFYYTPLINKPTRIPEKTAFLINLIFTNDFNSIPHSHNEILITDI